MPESFFDLARADQRDALLVAAARSGRGAHLLEKDVWVVWVLRVLFESPFGRDLVFKGGTSLSKAYRAIARFSEDVDLTYDIRALAPDLTAGVGDILPRSRSQEDRWTTIIRRRLPEWIERTVLTFLRSQLDAHRLDARVAVSGDVVELRYDPLVTGTGYVRPVVLLEFGARSTGEPFETRRISCDACEHLPDLAFPEALPQVMCAERTFWEKATAIHVFCRGGRFRGAERFSRHWYDVVGLNRTGFVKAAIVDRHLAQRWPDTRRCSFGKRLRVASSSTTTERRKVSSGLFQTATASMFSHTTMTGWSRMVFCSKSLPHSRSFSIPAEPFRMRPTPPRGCRLSGRREAE